MCGINAIFSFSDISESDRLVVSHMNLEMRYRGPDDTGVWSDNTACLGAVRLAIIGIGNGHQPMLNESRDVVLVCNGEIYNSADLKESLIKKGHHFATDTDIEVLLHLYEDNGMEFVKQVKGMFSFVLYDSRTRSMLFGRDRLGEKPLYYSQQFGKLIVSSELKTIAIFGDQDITPDDTVVHEASFSSFPQDPERTLFNEVKRVLPGEYITVSASKLERYRFWNGRRNVTFSGTEVSAANETLRLLRQAVERTMIADVPIAVMLSGGIDSSAIAAIARESSPHLQAISVGYEGNSAQDERSVSRRFANENGINLHEIELTKSDFLSAFEEYIKILDEPIWDPASVMQWHIFKRARALGFKVLLSGQGADELFFGYPSELDAASQFECLKLFSAYLPIGRRACMLFVKDLFQSPHQMFKLLRARGKGEWTRSESDSIKVNNCFMNPRSTFWSYQHGSEDPCEARFNYYREIYLSANGFMQTDKLSMAHSVEVRSPFADADLVNFLMSLPQSILTRNGVAKLLLRKSLQSVLPKYILSAAKRGFQPSDDCIRELYRANNCKEDDWGSMSKEIAARVSHNIKHMRSRHQLSGDYSTL